MNKKKMLCIISSLFLGGLFCFGGGSGVHAAPADPNMGKIPFEQPDGKTFEGELKGDEYLNYVVVDKTSDIVVQGKDNYWYYAQKGRARTGIQASGKKYLIDEKPADTLSEKEAATVKVPVPKQSRQASTENYKLNRDQNLLVVLVEYNNQKFNTSAYPWGMREESSVEQWQQKIFGEGSEDKSVKNYYKEATQDRINLVPAQTSQFTSAPGVIKVSLDEDHPNSDGTQRMPETSYMRRALQKAEEHIELSAYDKNKDGKLEINELHVMFIVAGFEMSRGSKQNGIWAHKRHDHLATKNDLYFLNGYFAVGEKMLANTLDDDGIKTKDIPSSIGVIAHEMGHDLGLPDLYGPETSTGGYGLGYHSVMATGSWGGVMTGFPEKPERDMGALPTHFDAYSKMKLGFPVETIENGQEVLAKDISSGEFKLYKLPIYKDGKKSEDEYYLIENRQMFGFDVGRRHHNNSTGISIYHINEKYSDNVNISNYGDQLVTLKEADQSIHGYPLLSKGSGDSSKSYFKKETNLSEFNRESLPTSQTKDGKSPNLAVFVEESKDNAIKIIFKDSLLIKGVFGTAPWTWDTGTKTLTFKGGTFANGAHLFNLENGLNGEKIEKIVFTEKIKLSPNASALFSSLRNLKTIENANKLDTSEVTDMSKLFSFNDSLEEVDLNGWDTSKVTTMASMFYLTYSLKSVRINQWNTSNVTKMNAMFLGHKSSLRALDLSNWDTSKVEYMTQMFPSNLSSLTLGENFRFQKGASLRSATWVNKESDVVYNSVDEFMTYDGSIPGTYEIGDSTIPWTWDTETKTLTFKGGTFANGAHLFNLENGLNGEKIEKIVFTEKIKLSPNASALFSSLRNLKTIENANKLDTSEVTDMSKLFSFNDSLEEVDLNGWDTSKVTTMASMFYLTYSLKSVRINQWNTSNVTKMNAMFLGHKSSLRALDLSNWDTSKVEYMTQMFPSNLSSLTLGENFRFQKGASLRSATWVNKESDVVYNSVDEFMMYDGSIPGTYEIQ
ncbi:BspA family leucine-rich repeat surface protein [Enterococcus ureasiticus]|uniref:EF-hand domain-containing protein n=1 Tax=Enterococcus ureasiticus TaxID=903984 RepID=A0A1E5GC70_9ENTE|nr:BspA family leucine-rich repeat surface protein [Enterococcus ureasiticus]OEG10298.1 hypothetical protein BCR21_13180 [Enterococcus ureasiticus]